MKSLKTTLLTVFIIGLNSLWAQVAPDTNLIKYNKIPTTTVFKMDSTKTSFKKLFAKNIPTVVMFYNPECDHCQHELEEMLKNYESLKGYKFIMVTNRYIFQIKEFRKKYNLAKYKNFISINESTNALIRNYGISGFPSLVIYNKSHQVTGKYVSSIVAISEIIEKLEYTF